MPAPKSRDSFPDGVRDLNCTGQKIGQGVGHCMLHRHNHCQRAMILRKHMLIHILSFDDTFYDACIIEVAPPSLLLFVGMIEQHDNGKSQLRFGAPKTELAMTPLLHYNYYVTFKEGAQSQTC